jgi:hypothetical protein
MTVSREFTGVQVRWDKVGTGCTEDYTLFYGKENEKHQLELACTNFLDI